MSLVLLLLSDSCLTSIITAVTAAAVNVKLWNLQSSFYKSVAILFAKPVISALN